MAEWSARRARNPAVSGSSPALATTWICFTVAPSSNPRPCLKKTCKQKGEAKSRGWVGRGSWKDS